jgi:hypothetical protein
VRYGAESAETMREGEEEEGRTTAMFQHLSISISLFPLPLSPF